MIPFEAGSINLLSLFVIQGVIFGMVLMCYLFFTKSEKSGANLFLALIVLHLTLILSPVFIYLMGLLEEYPHFIKIYMLGEFMIGPITYFYVRKCTQKDFKISPIMWLHFLPMLLDFIYHIPFYSLGGEEKLTYFYSFFENQEVTEPPLLSLTKIVFVLAYIFISIRIVIKYRKHLDNTASYIDEAYHRWLLVLCFSMLIPALPILALIITGNFPLAFSSIMIGIPVFVTIVLALILIKPELFQKFPHQMLIVESSEQKGQKYENSNLQELQKGRYVKKLITYVETHQPFHEPELTLAQLAEKVHIPAHHLSQVINEKLNCNFLDFINGYRIEDAKEKLVDNAYSHYTVIAIAYEVGFNSKTAFYSAFKKQTGTTPSSYRKQALAS